MSVRDMASKLDHSLSYKKVSFKNAGHFCRKKSILNLIHSFNLNPEGTYFDVGCSNGYLTRLITDEIGFKKVVGLDHAESHLERARLENPAIIFDFIDLNLVPRSGCREGSADFVTCFECLEHVGSVNNAIKNIVSLSKEKSVIFVSVPIEIGFWGVIKFLCKTIIFQYRLDELAGKPRWSEYFFDLIKGARISKYRELRQGWSTHFGFDYREVDEEFLKLGLKFKAFNSFTTRFYVIKRGQG